jgi:3-hydroxyacyl-CoA dehydrogenase
MTNILGGGGSLRYLLEHIGTAANVWTEDMKKHAFQLTPENIDLLDSGVQSWTQRVHLKSLEKKRDETLMELIAVKSRASSLE